MLGAHFNYRFLVDDASLTLDGIERDAVERALEDLADQLQLARSRDEVTGILSGFESIECTPGMQLYELLTSEAFDRDIRRRAYGLLDKCRHFDSDPDFYVEPEVEVAGSKVESYAMAAALEAGRHSIAVGLLGLSPPYGPGVVAVSDAAGEGQAVVVTNAQSRVAFYRWRYSAEDLDEEQFFEQAPLAFPNLRFADGVTFRRFDGTYRDLREPVLHHLARISDKFLTAYTKHNGMSDAVSAELGIEMSMESPKTRQSEQLMRERDVNYDGRTYRCEWHSKIEPHRNRIHVHPGDAGTKGCVLIGIFVEHLST